MLTSVSGPFLIQYGGTQRDLWPGLNCEPSDSPDERDILSKDQYRQYITSSSLRVCVQATLSSIQKNFTYSFGFNLISEMFLMPFLIYNVLVFLCSYCFHCYNTDNFESLEQTPCLGLCLIFNSFTECNENINKML